MADAKGKNKSKKPGKPRQPRKSKTSSRGPKDIRLKVHAGAVIALRLSIRNRMMAAVLIHPGVDNWVVSDGKIISAQCRIDPAYIYILQGGEALQTLTLQVPEFLQPGQILKSSLRFPGVEAKGVSIEIEITGAEEMAPKSQLLEYHFNITLPFDENLSRATNDELGGASEASYSLVAGLAGLEMIPARWLAAELLVHICQVGADYADTREGKDLLIKLGRTRFFKNGVLTFASAQVPHWVSSGLATASGLHSALGGKMGQGRILYIWEKWLMDLIGNDLENNQKSKIDTHVPYHPVEQTIERFGMNADQWFGNLVLGLVKGSSRFSSIIQAIIKNAPDKPAVKKTGTKNPGDVLGEGESLKR